MDGQRGLENTPVHIHAAVTDSVLGRAPDVWIFHVLKLLETARMLSFMVEVGVFLLVRKTLLTTDNVLAR